MRNARSFRKQRPPRQAAVFVDYANAHALLADRLDEPGQAHAYLAEAIGELRRYLADDDNTDTILTAAYADFSALAATSGAGDLQRSLYHQGVEPRFVPAPSPEAAGQDRSAEVQLSVDATALLHRRPDVGTFAFVTGDRTFLPLVGALRRQGARALVAALDPPPPDSALARGGSDDVFMDFLNLLGDDARRDLLQGGEMPARQKEGAGEPAGRRNASSAAGPSDPDHEALDDDALFRTLEITEEHFGQYDEVYLTPLLRKLSDVLGERFDPKAIVSDLEAAGAVRLAKRRGYPYDYTVLIVNRDHPDVQAVEDAFYDGNGDGSNWPAAREDAPAPAGDRAAGSYAPAGDSDDGAQDDGSDETNRESTSYSTDDYS